jgi:hypothetical protein
MKFISSKTLGILIGSCFFGYLIFSLNNLEKKMKEISKTSHSLKGKFSIRIDC